MLAVSVQNFYFYLSVYFALRKPIIFFYKNCLVAVAEGHRNCILRNKLVSLKFVLWHEGNKIFAIINTLKEPTLSIKRNCIILLLYLSSEMYARKHFFLHYLLLRKLSFPQSGLSFIKSKYYNTNNNKIYFDTNFRGDGHIFQLP